MSDVTFSISELIQDAWSKFKEKPGFWILITIISIAVGYFGDYGLSIDPESFEASFTSIQGFLMSIISLYLSASITLIYIKYMRGESVTFNDLIGVNFNKFIHYILAVLVSGVLMILGFVLLILPGFYVMARLIFAQYLVLDRNLSFSEAITTSFNMSDGHVLNFISFIFAMAFLVILGFLSLLFGVLIAIPVSSLATAKLYLLFSEKA